MGKFNKKGGGGAGIKGKRKKQSKAQRKEAKLNVLQQKPDGINKKPNPFDLVFATRQKNANSTATMGKMSNKRPFQTGTKPNSTDIRKKTLDVEFQHRRKANQIMDKRIGQRDVELSEEAKAEKRFLFQQKKLSEKRSTIRIDESTGVSRGFDDNPSESTMKRVYWKNLFKENPDAEDKNIQSDEEGLENENDGKEPNESGGMKRKSRREIVSEMVSHDRRLRAIKSMLNDEQEEKTEDLDKCYREIRKLGLLSRKTEEIIRIAENENEADSYDTMYRELQLEPKSLAIPRVVTQSTSSPESEIISAPDTSSVTTEKRIHNIIDDFQNFMKEFDQIVSDRPITEEDKRSWTRRIDELIKNKLYPTIKTSPYAGSKFFLEKLYQMRQQYIESDQIKAESPTLQQIAFTQMVSIIFPSHLRFHPVSTPTLAFGMELLAQCRIRCLSQSARVIVLCDALFQWVEQSGRYLPEVMATLLGTLQLCVPQLEDNEQFPTMSFPISRPQREIFCIRTKILENPILNEQFLPIFEEEEGPTDEHSKLLIIRSLLKIIRKYAEKYSNANSRPAFNAVFPRFYHISLRLPVDKYPLEMEKEARDFQEFLKTKLEETATVTQLKIPARIATRAIKMLEPRFEEHYNPERPSIKGRTGATRQQQREKQWEKRAKRERRGAIKELRKDARHIAGLYSEQQRKIRQERDEKTKRILQTLEVQESEYKKLRAISGKLSK